MIDVADMRRAPPASGLDTAMAWVNRVAFCGLLGAVFLAPVPLGSNRPWAMALLALWVWAFLLLALGSYMGRRSWPTGLRRARWPLGCAALFSALIAAQLAWTHLVAPATLSLWHTEQYLMRSLACLGAMVLAVLTVVSRRRCTTVLVAMLASGLFQSGLGILLSRSGAAYEFLFVAFEPNGRVSGTFVNPNHFAGYMSLALAAGIGLLIAQYEGYREVDRAWRSRLSAFLQFALSLKMILRLSLVILVIGLVLSYSRMGNVGFFLALVLGGLVLAVRSRKMRRPALTLVGTMLVVDVLILGQWIGFDRIAERFQGTSIRSESAPVAPAKTGAPTALVAKESAPVPREESVEERLQVPQLAAKLALQKPWFGHGGGTFSLAFAPVKPDWVYGGQWNYAHNDFAEVAVDMGLIGLALWLGIGAFSAFSALRLINDTQPRLNRGVGTAALVALISTGFQSVTDFGLQIPALALSLSVLLSMSWLVSGLALDKRRAPRAAE